MSAGIHPPGAASARLRPVDEDRNASQSSPSLTRVFAGATVPACALYLGVRPVDVPAEHSDRPVVLGLVLLSWVSRVLFPTMFIIIIIINNITYWPIYLTYTY